MIYEIGIYYDGTEHDVQFKLTLPNLHFPQKSYKFWQGGLHIPHWIEDVTNNYVWIKPNVLTRTTKVYVDDSANSDLSNGYNMEFILFTDVSEINKWQNTDTANLALVKQDNSLYYSGASDSGVFQLNTDLSNTTYAIEFLTRAPQYWPSTSSGACGLFLYNSGGNYFTIFFHGHSSYTDGIVIRDSSALNHLVYDGYDTSKYYKSKYDFQGTTLDYYLYDDTDTLLNHISSKTYNEESADLSYIQINDSTSSSINLELYLKYLFVHKYLSTEPKILYIRPVTHLFWHMGSVQQ